LGWGIFLAALGYGGTGCDSVVGAGAELSFFEFELVAIPDRILLAGPFRRLSRVPLAALRLGGTGCASALVGAISELEIELNPISDRIRILPAGPYSCR
jgi:hypothetical protein